MESKKQYQAPEIKRWGTITDLTQAGLFEAIFGGKDGSGSSNGSGNSNVSQHPSGGNDGKIGSIL